MVSSVVGSWANQGCPCYTTEELLAWIQERNQTLTVHVTPNRLSESTFWFYDKSTGQIVNQNHSFFQISGIRAEDEQGLEQPVILQDEIGFLGILCHEINGTLHFLMQAKIEPGNVNKIQISPTLQATKSNFTQKHGGGRPPYLDYFLHAERYRILVDQIQSEQSSRFYKKRNRNVIVYVEDEVPALPSHRWMTLGQIKRLMRCDNLVNMDTRTVLSCIPFALMEDTEERLRRYFQNQALYRSIFCPEGYTDIQRIFHGINNCKMFCKPAPRLVRLDELSGWEMDDFGIRCRKPYSFSAIYCDIEVEGREVRKWTQPLFKAEGIAVLGLYTTITDGKQKFLTRIRPEIGCFDGVELGPAVQREAVCLREENEIDRAFMAQYARRERVLYDVLLSEEGGRFYHEENRNIILETDYFEPPAGYFWADYRTLNLLAQFNNCLNIQLRNLLSLLEV
ncbi:MAG: dNDP-4-keto-6-deoxy-glucose-2,3- dehydratase [Lawsonibacter sp.]|nr:dNDP-4-keto-6-deoxy-glucose-2,3- dehydratase [Lawsonibacter sp.]